MSKIIVFPNNGGWGTSINPEKDKARWIAANSVYDELTGDLISAPDEVPEFVDTPEEATAHRYMSKSLDELKANLWNQVKERRTELYTSGMKWTSPVTGNVYYPHTDGDARADYLGLYIMASVGQLPNGKEVTMVDNANPLLTPDELMALALAVGEYRTQVHSASQQKRGQIKLLDLAGCETYDVKEGFPLTPSEQEALEAEASAEAPATEEVVVEEPVSDTTTTEDPIVEEPVTDTTTDTSTTETTTSDTTATGDTTTP